MKWAPRRFILVLMGLSIFLTNSTFAHIHQADFESINESVFKSYASIIASKLQSELIMIELWENFGGAFRVDSAQKSIGQNKFIITLTGEIPQNKVMLPEGYAIVACHEMGHILGGEPKQKNGFSRWSSVEGQADYFATNDCMWRHVNNMSSVKQQADYDAELVRTCEQYYISSKKILGCLQIMTGIIAMQDYFNNTSSRDNPVNYQIKDKTAVLSTPDKYPSNQCRLDTMMAGLFNQDRPSCWYKEP